MNNLSRRRFLQKSVALSAAGLVVPSFIDLSSAGASSPRVHKNTIGIAQWALVNEIREGKWTNLDFPRIAREEFGIGAIEFVNTLWEVPTMNYLNRLKQNAENNEVTMVGIACDAEGDACSFTTRECRQFAINHRKWIDAAQYLGCKAIRINCIGPRDGDVNMEEALKWSAQSCKYLLEYAIPANIVVLVENHGGVSNDPDFMVALMEEVNSLYLGVLPDWRRPTPAFDNYEFLRKTLPYSGISTHYRPQPTEEHTAKMIRLCIDSGFSGYYCIESGPREEIKKGKDLLSRYLNI
jgi:L-ribulose-5-phosphate 3-epimerase